MSRAERATFAAHPPDLLVIPDGDLDPEQEALLAGSVSLALLVVVGFRRAPDRP